MSVSQQLKPKMAVAGRTQQDLLRLVSALSGACRADRNVLKDSQLVDLLESQAKAILATRRQTQRRKTVDAPTISPQRTKLIKKLADANAESGASTLSKRRKLSFETETQKRPASPIKPRSFGKSGGVVDLYGKNPAADYGVPYGATNVSVFSAAIVNHMAQRSGAVSPQQFSKSGGGHAFKSLDRSSVDLSASMASTVVSTAAGYYDDMYDDLSASRYRRADSPGVYSRGRGSPCSDLTQSVDSIDWSPSDDEDENEPSPVSLESESKPLVSFSNAVDGDVVVTSSEMKSSTEVVMQVLYGIMHHDQNYKWLVDPENQARVAKLVEYHQLQQQNGSSASSMSPSEELQAKVDELVRENARIQSENARLLEVNQMSVCDVEEQKKQVHELLLKLQTSVSAKNNNSKPVASSSPSDLERRLAESQEQLAAQETCRREAEVIYESELEAKSKTIASLKQELLGKDEEISSLMKQVEAISAAHASKTLERSSFDGSASFSSSTGFRRSALKSDEPVDADESMILHLREVNVARETEVKRLRAVLMDKDREICNLYMHLSTKKKLIEEISSRFLQQVQSIASRNGESISLDDLNLNLDMFLFKNVVDKQKSVDELTAALGVMEREVEKLEERVEHFESENYTLKVTKEDLAGTLESANSEFMRVSAENELMETSLKEKQTRIRNLMLYLEEKEDQIMRLKDAAEQLRFAR